MWGSSIIFLLFLHSTLKADSVLGGVAAIIGSSSPMVVSAIQSVADRDIARIASTTEIKMTAMEADVAKYKIDAEAAIAKENMRIAANINDIQNQGETTRLSMILAMLRETNEKYFEVELKKLEIEKEYLDTKIKFEKAQADAMYKLAKMKLNLELMKDDLRGIFEQVNSGKNIRGGSSLENRKTARLLSNVSEKPTIKMIFSEKKPTNSLLQLLRKNYIVSGSRVDRPIKRHKPVFETDLSSFIRSIRVVKEPLTHKTHSQK